MLNSPLDSPGCGWSTLCLKLMEAQHSIGLNQTKFWYSLLFWFKNPRWLPLASLISKSFEKILSKQKLSKTDNLSLWMSKLNSTLLFLSCCYLMPLFSCNFLISINDDYSFNPNQVKILPSVNLDTPANQSPTVNLQLVRLKKEWQKNPIIQWTI